MNGAVWLEKPAVRQAIQTAIGVGAAIAAGSAISGQRWYWAVIAAFIVAMGVGSRTEAAVKGLQRMVGTILGVAVGIGLATLISGHTFLALGLALIFAFFGFYAFQVAYGTMIFFITLMVALLYGLLGSFKPELLLLRLEETAAGVAIGVVSVVFVLPLRQDEAFHAALESYLEALACVLSPPEQQRDPSRAIVELQSKTRELRNAQGAAKRGWASLVTAPYRDTIRAAMRCTYLAREWMLTDRPWDRDTEVRSLASRAVRLITNMKGAAPDGSEPRPESHIVPAPGTMAVEILQKLLESIHRLAVSAAPLRKVK